MADHIRTKSPRGEQTNALRSFGIQLGRLKSQTSGQQALGNLFKQFWLKFYKYIFYFNN
jgi:hypothetical protein